MIKFLEALFSYPAKLLDAGISFFSKNQDPIYPLSAHLNSEDSRDVHIATIQSPVALELSHKTDLSMFETINQLGIGSCIWQARRMMRQYMWYKKTGQIKRFSARSGYILSKGIDGFPDVQGTTARAADSILFKTGIAEDEIVPDDNTLAYDKYLSFPVQATTIVSNMAQYKIGGYATVPADFNSIKQAIFQNGVICFTLGLDANWFVGIIMRVLSIVGYHGLIGYGYDVEGIFGKNSWGTGWIAVLAKAMGFPAGDFYIKWSDYQNDIYDIVAYVDVPTAIIDNAKSLNYHFSGTMLAGQTTPAILQLQKRLEKEGYWTLGVEKTGFYGVVTASAVLKYQFMHKIDTPDNLEALRGRYVGPKTIAFLNGEVGLDLLHAQIQVESEGNDYAVGDKNLVDHAYGCLQIRQGVMDTYNRTKGTSFKSQDCLGNRELSIDVWTTYWTVYKDMITDKDKAFAWNGGVGWRQFYGKPKYEKYTANLDAYWNRISPMLA